MRETVIKNCEQCSEVFAAQMREVRRGRGRFCSMRCGNTFRARANATKPRASMVFQPSTPRQVKVRAHHIVDREIAAGRLIRKPCESCGKRETDAHHEDYSKPLEVIWFCRSCHLRHHRSKDGLAAGIQARTGRLSGVNHPKAKLTAEQVHRIREMCTERSHTQAEIGKMFQIDPSAISRIASRKQYANV